MLRDAWKKLHLTDRLHVVEDFREALVFMAKVDRKIKGAMHAGVAAVILDPHITGENTGLFLRAVERITEHRNIPIVLWTGRDKSYEVLEGRGVDSVSPKPYILQLVQRLDAACGLRASPGRPFQYHEQPDNI